MKYDAILKSDKQNLQAADWEIQYKKAGCKGASRGQYTIAGHSLSVDDCIAKCDKAGPKVCQSIEFGRSDINYQCNMWSGICEPNEGWNSTIYVRKG